MSDHPPVPQFVNRLISETSPYLLQHAHNPVEWYPWGEEAFAAAKAQNRPILLSIGYSACHWCHVMERESFENEEIAALMNEFFINVKVDREERPDVDTVYMNAVQLMTGRGGWPLTMFLTPEGEPFYGGTYFPPTDRPTDRGISPGFPRILRSVADAYKTRRSDVGRTAGEILDELNRMQAPPGGSAALSRDIFKTAYRKLGLRFDHVHGGFGQAPKFPNSLGLSFLLRFWKATGDAHARHMVELSLRKMALGGMYDQLGGGFHRYSTDVEWLVPHFEKMLYDNALLSRLFLEVHQATGKPFFRRIVEETLDYVLREMTGDNGGFYSTQDADSEGEEGKFFVWTPTETGEILDEREAKLFNAYYGVTDEGNFEHTGTSILNITDTLDLVALKQGVSLFDAERMISEARKKLREARETRVKPARDDKQVVAWNGMMLVSFARAAAVLDRDDYLAAAIACGEFIERDLLHDGRLCRTFKNGTRKYAGYQEDYACAAEGLLALHETTLDVRWLKLAKQLTDTMLELFLDPEGGPFFFTGSEHESLITRVKEYYDNATPSGNSVAVEVLLRLAILTGEDRYRRVAVAVLESLADAMGKVPSGFGKLLCALDFHLSSPKEVAIVGDPAAEDTHVLLAVVSGMFLPNLVLTGTTGAAAEAGRISPLLHDRDMVDGKATAYVCENYTCQAPVTTPEDLHKALAGPRIQTAAD